MTVVTWSALPAVEVFPGITRQVLDGELQTMVRYLYQPGATFPEHSHPEEQITVVVSGQIEFLVDGKVIMLGAGQAATIPPGVLHGARVIGNQPVETFNALSPQRLNHPAPDTEMGR